MTDIEIPDFMGAMNDRVEDALSAASNGVVLRWGTVTQADPLRVKLDADADPLPFKPVSPIVGLKLEERVLCAIQNQRVTIINVAGRAIAQSATQAQVDAGVDETTFVTPKTLRERAPDQVGVFTPGPGWSIYSLYDHKLTRINNVCYLQVMLVVGSGAQLENFGSVPVGFRPSSSANAGMIISSGGRIGSLRVLDTGKVDLIYPNSVATGTYVPINAVWQV